MSKIDLQLVPDLLQAMIYRTGSVIGRIQHSLRTLEPDHPQGTLHTRCTNDKQPDDMYTTISCRAGLQPQSGEQLLMATKPAISLAASARVTIRRLLDGTPAYSRLQIAGLGCLCRCYTFMDGS